MQMQRDLVVNFFTIFAAMPELTVLVFSLAGNSVSLLGFLSLDYLDFCIAEYMKFFEYGWAGQTE